jgi:hypothetical protein
VTECLTEQSERREYTSGVVSSAREEIALRSEDDACEESQPATLLKREKATEISTPDLRFFLDSVARENYTFVSCFTHVNVAVDGDIDWERRQTQPGKASKQWQHTQGTRSSRSLRCLMMQHPTNIHRCFRECMKQRMLFA